MRDARHLAPRIKPSKAIQLLLVLAIGVAASIATFDGPAPVRAAGEDLWLSDAEIAALPTSGSAWERVRDLADDTPSDTNLSSRDEHNVDILAVALVAARLDDDGLRDRAADAIAQVMEASPGEDLLGASRSLATYPIAADLIDLSEHDPDLDGRFRSWLDEMLHRSFSEGSGGADTIAETHDLRPNNWGTHAGASRIAVAIYLGDDQELEEAAAVFRGWVGDRSAYDDFNFGDLDWQADPDAPVGVNPAGATLAGHPVDGVVPDDQRRAGDLEWPPPKENYVWEGLQGAVLQAELLDGQGYDAWGWGDQALRRALEWLHEEADYPAEGNDTWIPWLVNHAYGTDFPTESAQSGRAVGFTDWTHSAAGAPRAEGDEPDAGDGQGDGDGQEGDAPEEHVGPFRDVGRSAIHAESIEELIDRGITNGCASDRYCPRDPVTREQMATFLVHSFDLDEADDDRFDDVSGTHAANVAALADAGITAGCDGSDGSRFCPREPVSRAQMASFLRAALELSPTDDHPFDDVSGTHAPSVGALAEAEITLGCRSDRFCPDDAVNRGQMASFLIQALRD